MTFKTTKTLFILLSVWVMNAQAQITILSEKKHDSEQCMTKKSNLYQSASERSLILLAEEIPNTSDFQLRQEKLRFFYKTYTGKVLTNDIELIFGLADPTIDNFAHFLIAVKVLNNPQQQSIYSSTPVPDWYALKPFDLVTTLQNNALMQNVYQDFLSHECGALYTLDQLKSYLNFRNGTFKSLDSTYFNIVEVFNDELLPIAITKLHQTYNITENFIAQARQKAQQNNVSFVNQMYVTEMRELGIKNNLSAQINNLLQLRLPLHIAIGNHHLDSVKKFLSEKKLTYTVEYCQ